MSVGGVIVAAATPIIAVGFGREWWAAEAIRADTDWPGVVDTALEMLVAGGVIEPELDIPHWDAPSWREAAVGYHRDRPGSLAVEIDPKPLVRLRRLMANGVSLERAWHELRDNRATPVVTIEAIKQAVRDRGLAALNEPAVRARVQRCDGAPLASVNEWLVDFKKKT